ncbi:hypothetical protein Tco_0096815 [Tanacetum coccineum]
MNKGFVPPLAKVEFRVVHRLQEFHQMFDALTTEVLILRICQALFNLLTSQPPVYQAQPYQAPTQEMQGVLKTDFENYVKANDVVLRNMQNQGLSSLPSNTVTNPKEDLKGITTRSGTAYQGPTIPTSKEVERRTECTELTKISSIQFSFEQNVERYLEIANEQKRKFNEIFKDSDCALIDVYEGELTLRVGNETITYNLDQTSRYSVNYNDMTANRIDVVELACEEYSQEVLGFSNVIASADIAKITKITDKIGQLRTREQRAHKRAEALSTKVKSWGKPQLKDKKDNSGVKVHLGSNKRHSQALIGQYIQVMHAA